MCLCSHSLHRQVVEINLCSRASKDRTSKCPTQCTYLSKYIGWLSVKLWKELKNQNHSPNLEMAKIHILELQWFRDSDCMRTHLTPPQGITYTERVISYKIWITGCKWDTKGKIDKWVVVTIIIVPAHCCTFSAEATTVCGSSLSYGPP